MKKINLKIRQAKKIDAKQIHILSSLIYGEEPYPLDILKAQIQNFPEGQFVAELNGEVVGYCASIIIDGKKVLGPHTWGEVTGGGYCSTHNPNGDYLYGVEVFVNPNLQGRRIGDRLYKKRKELCKQYRLKGIIFGGRMPLLAKKIKQIKTPEKYIELVRDKKIKDSVLGFQLRQGFEVHSILKNYYPPDTESLGYAVLLIWHNPEVSDINTRDAQLAKNNTDHVIRIATVQYMQRGISDFNEFAQIVEYFIDVVADYRSDFVCFPEFFTLQLLSIENKALEPEQAIVTLTSYTEKIKSLFQKLSLEYNINIIAGTHPTMIDNKVNNISYVFLRDGSVHQQAKIHPTPNEEYWWNISGCDKLSVINTDCGPIGVLICYDSEFPELARHLVDQGAKILFVPFCTDERQSYLRVRYCCQARAVENQVYVVMSGNVGNLPRVHNMDIQYAQSCILTPCDFVFSRDGIAADTTPNVETVAFADLRLDSLNYSRFQGTVQNLKNRRHDLYRVVWHKD